MSNMTKDRARRRKFDEKFCTRQFTVSGTLVQKNKHGHQYRRFLEDLDNLLAMHGVEKDPCLVITVIRENGTRTPIAQLDKG